MIDQNLVEQNIKLLSKNLLQSTVKYHGMRKISTAFDDRLMSKILQYLDLGTNDLWIPETDRDYIPMNSKPRLKLSWHAETVIEELHMICESLTPTLKILYPDRSIQFLGVTVWRDSRGYNIDWHTDNPLINISMQIYLCGGDHSPGTTFQLPDGEYCVPFIPNSGYMADNSETQRLLHKIEHPVLDQSHRYSLFAIWTTQSE